MNSKAFQNNICRIIKLEKFGIFQVLNNHKDFLNGFFTFFFVSILNINKVKVMSGFASNRTKIKYEKIQR